MPITDAASPVSRFLIATTDHLALDNELIVFSAKHQQYFGIEGTGSLILTALDREHRPMSQTEIVNLMLGGQQASASAVTLIHEAINLLLDLGVLREA